MASMNPNYYGPSGTGGYNQYTTNMFVIGERVVPKDKSIWDPQCESFTVIDLPGALALYQFPEMAIEVTLSNGTSYTQIVKQADFLRYYTEAPKQPKEDVSEAFKYIEADEPEFDDDCLPECLPGEHKCGK